MGGVASGWGDRWQRQRRNRCAAPWPPARPLLLCPAPAAQPPSRHPWGRTRADEGDGGARGRHRRQRAAALGVAVQLGDDDLAHLRLGGGRVGGGGREAGAVRGSGGGDEVGWRRLHTSPQARLGAARAHSRQQGQPTTASNPASRSRPRCGGRPRPGASPTSNPTHARCGSPHPPPSLTSTVSWKALAWSKAAWPIEPSMTKMTWCGLTAGRVGGWVGGWVAGDRAGQMTWCRSTSWGAEVG